MNERLESLVDLILDSKASACSKVIAVVITHLQNEGFTTENFLDGLADYFDSRNYSDTLRFLEEAKNAFRDENKTKID